MPRKILDTSVLVRHWRMRCAGSRKDVSLEMATRWGQELCVMYPPAFVVSPVIIEFVAGAREGTELRLFRTFMDPIPSLDQGIIPPTDWVLARKLAERIPKSGKPRQLGDCIISAIARRSRCDVITFDKDFPH
jgi:predicted nucleic acid-binding protein